MTRRFSRLMLLALAGLLAAQFPARAAAADAVLVKSAVLESNVAYLRVGDVARNLADEIRAAQTMLAVSNNIAGTVLDLRFADGDDLDSAKAATDLFTASKMPLAILVNSQTRGAAEKLASELRVAHLGLVFESEARAAQTNNEKPGLLEPDIAVSIGTADERSLMDNPYAALVQNDANSPPATNALLPFVDHTSEADLVRAKIKDGEEDGNFPPAQEREPSKPIIRDPVLARAVDLIQGLAIVRASHS